MAARTVGTCRPSLSTSRARTTPELSGLWSDLRDWWALSPIHPSEALSLPGQRVLMLVRPRASDGARYASDIRAPQLAAGVLTHQGLGVVILAPGGHIFVVGVRFGHVWDFSSFNEP